MAKIKCPNCGKPMDTNHGVCMSCYTKVLPTGRIDKSGTSKQKSSGKNNVFEILLAVIFLAGIAYLYLWWTLDSEEETVTEASRYSQEDIRKGFHCLSPWDGSHPDVKDEVKKVLHDPSSFEHVETKIAPADYEGIHELFMQYRARNGFGALRLLTARALISQASCDAAVISVE